MLILYPKLKNGNVLWNCDNCNIVAIVVSPDSSAVALHAALSMLPPSASFASVSIQQTGTTRRTEPARGLFTTTRRSQKVNKGRLTGL